jgi:hypothetical protein
MRAIPEEIKEMGTEHFRPALESLINRHSQENGSNTPDFILAKYLVACLKAFDNATAERETWYGRDPRRGPASGPGGGEGACA